MCPSSNQVSIISSGSSLSLCPGSPNRKAKLSTQSLKIDKRAKTSKKSTFLDDFEASIITTREAVANIIAKHECEAKIAKNEISARDAENKELLRRIAVLEEKLEASSSQISELMAAISKLHQFKQHVYESFIEESDKKNTTPLPRPALSPLQLSGYKTFHEPSDMDALENVLARAKKDTESTTETIVPHTVDGRDFFRHARTILSYDTFTQLLTNVKAFNARSQTKQKTLENLMSLFGDKHPDLYLKFERILAGEE